MWCKCFQSRLYELQNRERISLAARRQQTVVKHGDVDAFVRHVDSGDDL